MNGHIRLYRQMLDNPIICKDAEHLAIWIFILLNAKYIECDGLHNGKRITLKPGQFTVGRKEIADKLCISESKVQRVLKCFEIEQQIEQQMCSKNRLITVKNWGVYQQSEQRSEQRVNSNRTTTEQQLNTPKEINKERKKESKEKIYIYSANPNLEKAILDMIDNRKRLKKPMTQRAVELMLDKLDKMADNDAQKIAILNQSIERGWSGIFEVKDQVQPKYCERV